VRKAPHLYDTDAFDTDATPAIPFMTNYMEKKKKMKKKKMKKKVIALVIDTELSNERLESAVVHVLVCEKVAPECALSFDARNVRVLDSD
jgi:hypothetical protein